MVKKMFIIGILGVLICGVSIRKLAASTPEKSWAEGYYILIAKHSGMALSVPDASQKNGAAVKQWAGHETDFQQWSIRAMGNGYYTLVAKHSGKVLDVTDNSQENGAAVIQWEGHETDSQQWSIRAMGNGYYMLAAKHSGKVLEVSDSIKVNDAKVIQGEGHDGDNQQWLIVPSDNVAFGKPATQSSTYLDGEASRAVDGNTSGNWFNGSVTHTSPEKPAWWEVNLLSQFLIDKIVIWNRTDCCSDRLSGFKVYIDNDLVYTHTNITPGGETVIPLDRKVGQRVRIEVADNYLSLAEVQVFGRTNVAFGKPATQSSTNLAGEASRAVDGNTSGNWYDGSVTHTSSNTPAWWEVNLLSQFMIDTIVIWNRTDCCSDRLSGFRVYIDNDLVYTHTNITPGSETIIPLDRKVGQLVRIEVTNNYLSLAEVQVFGRKSSLKTSKLELLKKYAPKIWLAKDEEFMPSSVDWAFPFFERYMKDGKYCLTTKQELSNHFDCSLEVCKGNLKTAPIYSFLFRKTSNSIWLYYFTYYPYNKGKEVVGTWGNHVSDWEYLIVKLEKSLNDWVPKEINLQAHGIDKTHPWLNFPTVGTHPIVYAAEGSHGIWKDEGTNNYQIVMKDECSQGTSWDTWNNIEGYDLTNKEGLNKPWPKWMSTDYSNPGIGDPSNPSSGPIYSWGNAGDHIILVDGPTGPIDKDSWETTVVYSDGFVFDKSTRYIVEYNGLEKDVIIPNQFNGIYVQSIGEGAFASYSVYTNQDITEYRNNMTSITMENSIQHIGDHAFYGCSGIKKLILSNELESIGNSAFSGCRSLSNLEIPNKVKSIDNYAFAHCVNLAYAKLPEGISILKQGLFEGCELLKRIDIPRNVTKIENRVFYNCGDWNSLTSIKIPPDIDLIGDEAFNNTPIKNAYFMHHCPKSIGKEIFNNDCQIHYYYNETGFKEIFKTLYLNEINEKDFLKPIIAIKDFSQSSNFITYNLEVYNYNLYHDDMFVPSPDLPPCGTNTNASRSWVEIFDGNTNQYIYGFAGLTCASDLNQIWFSILKTETDPTKIYIKITDKLTNTVYSSNTISLPYMEASHSPYIDIPSSTDLNPIQLDPVYPGIYIYPLIDLKPIQLDPGIPSLTDLKPIQLDPGIPSLTDLKPTQIDPGIYSPSLTYPEPAQYIDIPSQIPVIYIEPTQIDEGYDTCLEDDSGSIDIKAANGAEGEKIQILVRIQNASNKITSFGFKVIYDTAILEYSGFESGELVNSFDQFEVSPDPDNPGKLIAGGFSSENSIPQGASGNLVYLKFTVTGGKENDCYPVQVERLTDELVGFSSSRGCFCISSCNGDLNGDGEITPSDALTGFKCYLGSGPCSDCADVNRDGEITPSDALCLFKKFLGQSSCLN